MAPSFSPSHLLWEACGEAVEGGEGPDQCQGDLLLQTEVVAELLQSPLGVRGERRGAGTEAGREGRETVGGLGGGERGQGGGGRRQEGGRERLGAGLAVLAGHRGTLGRLSDKKTHNDTMTVIRLSDIFRHQSPPCLQLAEYFST